MVCPSCNDHRKLNEGDIRPNTEFIDPNTFVRRVAWYCHKSQWKTWVGYTVEESEDGRYSDNHVQVALWDAYNNGNPTSGVMLHDVITVLDLLADI